ncbi:MAG TPA: hypothetical protein VGK67_01245 [Myxococcales bacterium]|jgi:hypothetical protein
MALVQEPAEPQAWALVAAEVSSAPDGSRFVRLATSRHAFQASAHLVSGAARAALFCGPAGFAATFTELSRTLAGQGVSALFVHPRPGTSEGDTLACCAEFLRLRGARTLALAAAGPCARTALEAACALDAEGVLLLSPAQTPAEPRADLLRGRSLLLCTAGEHKRFEPLSGLPHAARCHFALAGEAFDEVRSDLLAACVPFLAGGAPQAAPLHP